jgi:hypothetical protein
MFRNRHTQPQHDFQQPATLTRRERLQDDFTAALGEFFGTVLFLLLGLGGIQAANLAFGSGSNDATLIVS